MTVTVVAMVTINDDEPMALVEYFRAIKPLWARVGATVTKSFKINEVLIGQQPPKRVFIIEYPDREAVDTMFQSKEYKAVEAARNRAFLDYSITVAAAPVVVENDVFAQD